MRRYQRVPLLHDIPPAHFEGVDAQEPGDLINGRLNGEAALSQAVSTKGTARHAVGVDGVAVDLLVRATVKGDCSGRVVEDRRRMVAVGARVRKDIHLHGGQSAVASGA